MIVRGGHVEVENDGAPSAFEVREIVCSAGLDHKSLTRIGGFLNRSEVYRLNDGDAVLKFFYHFGELKWRREIAAYDLLRGEDLPIPKLFSSGHTRRNVPWLLLEHLPGVPLSQTYERHRDQQSIVSLIPSVARLGKALHAVGTRKDASTHVVAESLAQRLDKYREYGDEVIRTNVEPSELWRRAYERMCVG